MASLRRNRTMPTDGAISKFLYVIMKQLDLKSIDWQVVADQLDITNGHAARMRYSRFKQQMEGIPSTARKARATGPRQKKAKSSKSDEQNNKETQDHQGAIFKVEKQEEDTDAMPGVEPTVKEERLVKPEPVIKTELGGEEDGTWSPDGSAEAGQMRYMSSQPAALVNRTYLQPYSAVEAERQTSQEFLGIKAEPIVKMEPFWED